MSWIRRWDPLNCCFKIKIQHFYLDGSVETTTLIWVWPVHVSHLSSEDTDAVHPHQSSGQTFNKTFSRSIFLILPLSHLLLFIASFLPSSFGVVLFFSSQFLSPPSLRSSPPVPSSTPLEWTAETKTRPTRKIWHLSQCKSTRSPVSQLLSSFEGSWFPHFDLAEWLRNIYIFTYKYICVRTRTTLASERAASGDRCRNTHMDEQVNTQRQTCAHWHKHAQKFICYTQTTLHCFIRSGFWQSEVRLSEQWQLYGNGCSTFNSVDICEFRASYEA